MFHSLFEDNYIDIAIGFKGNWDIYVLWLFINWSKNAAEIFINSWTNMVFK